MLSLSTARKHAFPEQGGLSQQYEVHTSRLNVPLRSRYGYSKEARSDGIDFLSKEVNRDCILDVRATKVAESNR